MSAIIKGVKSGETNITSQFTDGSSQNDLQTLTVIEADGQISYLILNSSVFLYCTDDATIATYTDEIKNAYISEGASSTTNPDTIAYEISVKKDNSDITGWSLSSDGKNIIIPKNTSAGVYTVSITASVAELEGYYTSASTTQQVTVTIDSTSISSYGNVSQPVISQKKNFPAGGITLTSSNISDYFSTTTSSQTITYNNNATRNGEITYIWSGQNFEVQSLGTTVTTTETEVFTNIFTYTATGEGDKSNYSSISSGMQEINSLEDTHYKNTSGIKGDNWTYGIPTISASVTDNAKLCAGTSSTITSSVIDTKTYYKRYTSGSYTSLYTENPTGTVILTKTSDTCNDNTTDHWSLSSNGSPSILSHRDMETMWLTDTCVITSTNTNDSTKTNTITLTAFNSRSEVNKTYYATCSIGDGLTVNTNSSATVTSSAYYTANWKYVSGDTDIELHSVDCVGTLSIVANGNNHFSLEGNTVTHTIKNGTNTTGTTVTDTVTVRCTNASSTEVYKDVSISIDNVAVSSNVNGQYTASINPTSSTVQNIESTISYSGNPQYKSRTKYTWTTGDITYTEWSDYKTGSGGSWSTDSLWITCDSGTATTKTVTITANTTNELRTGNVTYTYGGYSTTATISQKGTQPVVISNNAPTYGTGGNLISITTDSIDDGIIYYSVDVSLTSSNYLTTGSSSLPTTSGRNAGNYTVYYYIPETTNISEISGSISATIVKANMVVTEVNYSGTYDGDSHSSTVKVTSLGWDGKKIVSGLTTAYGTTVTNSGVVDGVYNIKTETNYTPTSTVYYKISGGTNYNDYKDSITFEINKAESTLPKTMSGASVYYHNTAIFSYTNDYSGGTLLFRYDPNNGTSWTETSTSSDADRSAIGNTTIQCKVVGDANHNDSSWSSTYTLTVYHSNDARATITINSSSLVYNGLSQNIVTNVVSEGCNTYIGFGKSDSVAPTEWSNVNATTLSCVDAGTYYVWYKFTPDGNHSNSNTGQYVGSKNIEKLNVIIPTGISNVVYNGTTEDNGTSQIGISNYNQNGISYSGNINGINAGSYSAIFTVDSNHKWSDDTITNKTVNWTISRRAQTAPVLIGDTTTYPTTANVTVSETGKVSGTSVIAPGVLTWSNGNSLSIAGSKTTYAYYAATAKNFSESPVSNSVTLTVNNADMSIEADDQTYEYDGQIHGTAITVSTKGNQTATITYGTVNDVYNSNTAPQITTVSESKTIYYQITAPNHNTVTGTYNLTITSKEVSLLWGTSSWTYDGDEHSTTCIVANLIGNDTCIVILSNNSITNIGSTTVTATGLSNNNYELPSSGLTQTITINPGLFIKVSGTWTPVKKVYKKVSGTWELQELSGSFNTDKLYMER